MEICTNIGMWKDTKVTFYKSYNPCTHMHEGILCVCICVHLYKYMDYRYID